MEKLEILDAFAGLGGNRTFWDQVGDFRITAIEKNPTIAELYRKRYPGDDLRVMDVYDYLRDLFIDLDRYFLIWLSPPCPTHSQMMKFPRSTVKRIPIPDLNGIYGLKIWLDRNYSGLYVIENVQPYYKPLIKPTAIIDRHYFWANFHIKKTSFKNGTKPNHGKIAGIMREKTDDLIKKLHLVDIRDDLLAIPDKKPVFVKDRIIRNCVNPKIGEYILKQAIMSKKTLLDYIAV